MSHVTFFYATNETDCHDMTEILLKVAVNTINLNIDLNIHVLRVYYHFHKDVVLSEMEYVLTVSECQTMVPLSHSGLSSLCLVVMCPIFQVQTEK